MIRRPRRLIGIAALMTVTMTTAACGSGSGEKATTPTGSSTPGTSVSAAGSASPTASATLPLNPADFVATVDNPFMPFEPGTRFTFKGMTEEGPQIDVVEVTKRTKTILGIPAVVVHDTVTQDGEAVEDTFDWYAQDRAGNVWYLGEDTKEYENGKVVSTKGSWQAGVDGAEAGIIMEAQPKVGDKYRQEYYKGEAEDMAEVLSLDKSVTVKYGSFDGLLLTGEWTPLEPDIYAHKYYARGIGLVLDTTVKGESERFELVRVQQSG